MTIAEITKKMQEASSDEEREACFLEAEKLAAAIDAELKEKREELKRLTAGLLTYDSESLGDAVKCYISEGKDPRTLTDTAYRAFQSISEILILEQEC